VGIIIATFSATISDDAISTVMITGPNIMTQIGSLGPKASMDPNISLGNKSQLNN
jgi:hypothetical protein